MNLDLTTIRVFDNAPECHVYRMKLENEGIECFLFDEEMVTINPLINLALGGVKLKVKSTDLVQANEILSELEEKPITDEKNESIKCPNCSSTNLISDFKSIKGLKGIISTIISFVLFVYPLYYKYVFKCIDCNTEFKRERN